MLTRSIPCNVDFCAVLSTFFLIFSLRALHRCVDNLNIFY